MLSSLGGRPVLWLAVRRAPNAGGATPAPSAPNALPKGWRHMGFVSFTILVWDHVAPFPAEMGRRCHSLTSAWLGAGSGRNSSGRGAKAPYVADVSSSTT